MGFVSFCEFKNQYRLWIFTQELSKIQLYTPTTIMILFVVKINRMNLHTERSEGGSSRV